MLLIRNYRSADYEAVRDLFESGMREKFLPAVKRNWNGEEPATTLLHLGPSYKTFLQVASLVFSLRPYSKALG
jgi:hypothetical protein